MFNLQGEFDWGEMEQANLLSAFFYGYIFTQVLGGWVSDRLGIKGPLCVCMFAKGALNFLMPIGARQVISYSILQRYIITMLLYALHLNCTRQSIERR